MCEDVTSYGRNLPYSYFSIDGPAARSPPRSRWKTRTRARAHTHDMVRQAIRLSVEGVENISTIKAIEETRWNLTLADPLSTEKRTVWIEPDEESEIEGSRGVANFVMKWKESKTRCSVSIVEVSDEGLSCDDEDGDSTSGTLVVFEIRNAKIESCEKIEPFVAESTGGTEFGEDELEKAEDWCGYDDENDCQVAIIGPTFCVVDVKTGKKGGRRRKK